MIIYLVWCSVRSKGGDYSIWVCGSTMLASQTLVAHKIFGKEVQWQNDMNLIWEWLFDFQL